MGGPEGVEWRLRTGRQLLEIAARQSSGRGREWTRSTSGERECPQRHSLHDRSLRGGTNIWNAGTGNIRTRFESCPERPPLAKRPANQRTPVNQRVREFWSVWNGVPWRNVAFRHGTPCFMSNQRVAGDHRGRRVRRHKPFELQRIGRRARKNAGRSRARRFL
jgi:hypothetical protein